jgi:transcription termination factor Rho
MGLKQEEKRKKGLVQDMDYEKMSLAELKEAAKKAGLKSISALRKHELIDKLKENEKKNTPQKEKPASKVPAGEKNVSETPSARERIVSEMPPARGKTVLKTPPSRDQSVSETPPSREKTVSEAPQTRERIVSGTFQTREKAVSEMPPSKERTVSEAQQTRERTVSETPAVRERMTSYHAGSNETSQQSNTYRRPQQTQSNGRSDYRNMSNRNQTMNTKPQNSNSNNNTSAPQQKPFYRQGQQTERPAYVEPTSQELEALDSGETKEGILEVMPDGYGFIRCDNYLPGENDVYVSPAQIRRQNLKTGDIVVGNTRIRSQNEKFSALLYLKSVNGMHPSEALKRKRFEDLTPIFPNQRIHLETPGAKVGVRMMDLVSPIGKGQRGMIVSPPKAGKTTLLKQVASAITKNHPEMHLIILLIDERPEEVTDIKESIEGKNVEVIYSTFDELPENHKRVSEMVIERARRLVEHKKDVTILLDSITRLTRAYNLVVPPSGRTLSGGLDPAALHMPKKFFGAARNIREGGSLTILATALVETGSRMDDVVFEEFKGTGNMEIVLDRSLSEKRIFPAIDLNKSSTRRDDLLLTPQEIETNQKMHRVLNGMRSDDAFEKIIELFIRTKNNREFMEYMKKAKF